MEIAPFKTNKTNITLWFHAPAPPAIHAVKTGCLVVTTCRLIQVGSLSKAKELVDI